MDPDNSFVPGKAIQTFDRGIRIARYLLIFVSVLAAFAVAVAVTGRGTMSVKADLDDPYTIEFSDGRRVGISGGNTTTFENFEKGRDDETLADIGQVGLTVRISSDDTDSRITLSLMILGWLGAAWVGLLSLGRIVTSAREGDAFADGNPTHLRRLGAALSVVPVISFVGVWVLQNTIEADIPFTVSLSGTPSWVLIVVGVAMFALAEVFGEASRLRQFEEATI